jgi:hypothetical protein
MPTKNIAASITAITPSFRGGLSLRICLSKSSWSRRFIFEVPILSTRNATKLPPFHTPSRKRIGFLDLKAIIPANGGVSHQFKEIKASTSTGLRRAGVCQSLGAALALSQQHNFMSMGASHNDLWALALLAPLVSRAQHAAPKLEFALQADASAVLMRQRVRCEAILDDDP